MKHRPRLPGPRREKGKGRKDNALAPWARGAAASREIRDLTCRQLAPRMRTMTNSFRDSFIRFDSSNWKWPISGEEARQHTTRMAWKVLSGPQAQREREREGRGENHVFM